MQWVCSLCGAKQQDGYQIDGAHIRGKVSFSEDERAGGFDRIQNIIPLCVEHHRLFDATKGLAVVEIDPGEDLCFARWGCCWEGACVRAPFKETFRNLYWMSKGHVGEMIRAEYIHHKNLEISIAELYQFAKDPSSMEYRECTENFMN